MLFTIWGSRTGVEPSTRSPHTQYTVIFFPLPLSRSLDMCMYMYIYDYSNMYTFQPFVIYIYTWMRLNRSLQPCGCTCRRRPLRRDFRLSDRRMIHGEWWDRKMGFGSRSNGCNMIPFSAVQRVLSIKTTHPELEETWTGWICLRIYWHPFAMENKTAFRQSTN